MKTTDLIFIGIKGSVIAIEAATGRQCWSTHLKGSDFVNVVLDGDNLRHGLNSDLGFSAEDRSENIRRTGEFVVNLVDEATANVDSETEAALQRALA